MLAPLSSKTASQGNSGMPGTGRACSTLGMPQPPTCRQVTVQVLVNGDRHAAVAALCRFFASHAAASAALRLAQPPLGVQHAAQAVQVLLLLV